MNELHKSVTLGKGVVLAVMMVVGSGLLGLPGLVANIGTVQEVVFGWILIIFETGGSAGCVLDFRFCHSPS